ncbi:hypothetical protein DV737_g2131, partial [Chaetothyriales sp. CBS 132003]
MVESAPRPQAVPPSSYQTLALQHIKVSHVPESSPTPTSVILITLNRPEKYNAFTRLMQREMCQVYELIEVDPRVKCVVVTGAGSKAFCAGADLEIGFGSGGGKDVDHRDGGGRVSLSIHQSSKPTIAAINGSAVGVGITMCLPMAIRIAYEKAKVGFVFSRRGLIMEACSSYFLPRLIGHSRAQHLTLTGSVYPANHPLFSTLFSETCATPEATLKRALELADDVAKNTSLVSTKMNRDLMHWGPDSAEATHLLDSQIISALIGSKDNVEGIQSFLEKRPAQFEGRVPEDTPVGYPWWRTPDVSYPRGKPVTKL